MNAPLPAPVYDGNLYAHFVQRMGSAPYTTIAELGTRRVPGTPSTIRRGMAHPTAKYVGVDYQAGEDVDVVANASALSEVFARDSLDMVLACSVYEHLSHPWIVTNEIGKVLKPGGWLFVQTHHSFPLHAFPHDYYRYSTEALELLCSDAGLTVLASGYEFPVQIHSDEIPGCKDGPAYLNVVVLAEKPPLVAVVQDEAA